MIERYSTPEMKRLWSDDARFQRWLDVEIAACEVLAEEVGDFFTHARPDATSPSAPGRAQVLPFRRSS